VKLVLWEQVAKKTDKISLPIFTVKRRTSEISDVISDEALAVMKPVPTMHFSGANQQMPPVNNYLCTLGT
jgi:hypothetical protein